MKKAQLIDTLIFVAVVVSTLIAVHQSLEHGWQQSYDLLMISIGFFFWFAYRKARKQNQEAGNKQGPKGR